MDRRHREVKEWKKDDRVILNIKDLVFKKRPVKKLTERYMGSYIVEEIVSKNVVKLKMLASQRIYLVVNISRVMRYKELMKRQKVKKPKSIEVDKVEKQKVENFLNKGKIREVMKYLVCWKGFMAKNDI